jgi:acyl-homoserine lactone synthase
MIVVFKGSQRRRFAGYFELMFSLRYTVFIKEMGWNLPASQTKREIDEYDVDQAIYLLDVTGDGSVQGTVRLTPTVSYSVVADRFSHLVKIGEPARSPLVYEATRYIFRPLSRTARENRAAKARLLAAMVEWCLAHKLSHVQGVVDMTAFPHWIELVPQTIPLGLPHPYGGGRGAPGGGECIAFRWPATWEVIEGLRAYGGLSANKENFIAAENVPPFELTH